jgi:hypothetical protein
MNTHIVKLRRALGLLLAASLLGISFATVSAPSVVAASCTISGTNRGETLNGTAGPDVICGLGGNDTINGLGGNDTIYGGVGNDRINGGTGDDQLIGEAGADALNGGAGADTVDYSAASVPLTISIDGQANDGARGERDAVATDVENIVGGSGNDSITGSTAANDLDGGTGNDSIIGGGGDDAIDGGTGNDSIIGGSGNDAVDGGIGNDSLVGGVGDDVIDGGTGNDTISGEIGNDTLDGESGLDQVDGGAGTNTCFWEPRESRANTCVYDVTAPVISDFSISTESVDISSGDQVVTVLFSVQDDRDGVEMNRVYPGGFWYSSSEIVFAESFERVSGDALNATYLATYRFASTLRPASYEYNGLIVFDASWNAARLDWSDLINRGWQSSIEVVSSRVYESTPPSVLSVEFSQDQMSRSSGDQSLTIDVSVADDGVGIAEGAVFLTYFKDATFRNWFYIPAGVRISGDDAAATYRFTFTFPPSAQPGLWTLGGVWVVDANRNSTYLLDGDLRSRGFDWSLELTQ